MDFRTIKEISSKSKILVAIQSSGTAILALSFPANGNTSQESPTTTPTNTSAPKGLKRKAT